MENKRKPINETLRPVIDIAKSKGYKVFTFETSSPKTNQIFITDGKRIGTVQTSYGMLNFGTIHKPTKGIGSGFGLFEYKSIEDGIEESMAIAPDWVLKSDRDKIVKYESVEEYINKETILKYYFI